MYERKGKGKNRRKKNGSALVKQMNGRRTRKNQEEKKNEANMVRRKRKS